MAGVREWIAGSVLAAGLARTARADHGGSTAAGPGAGLGLGWLVVVGGVVALALGAWAVFAPDRDEADPGSPRGKRS